MKNKNIIVVLGGFQNLLEKFSDWLFSKIKLNVFKAPYYLIELKVLLLIFYSSIIVSFYN